jgi:hypothetical protein
MIGGFFSSVRAIATRCVSQPESFSPRSPTMVWYPWAGFDKTVDSRLARGVFLLGRVEPGRP